MTKTELDLYANWNSTVIFSPVYFTNEWAVGGTVQFDGLLREGDSLSFHLEGRGGYSQVPLDRLSGVAPLDPRPPHIGQAVGDFQQAWIDNDSDPLRQKLGYLGLSEIVLQYQPSQYLKVYAGEKFWEKQLPLQGWGGHPASRFGLDFMGQSPLGGGIELNLPLDFWILKEGIAEFSANCRDLKHCSLFGHAAINGAVSSLKFSLRGYGGWGNQAWPTDPNPDDPVPGTFSQGGIIGQLAYRNWLDISYAYAQLEGKNPEIEDRTTRRAHVFYLSSDLLDFLGIGISSYLVRSDSRSSVPERDPYQARSNLFFFSALTFSTEILKKYSSKIPTLQFQIAYQFSRDLELLENKGIGPRSVPQVRPLAYPEHMGGFSVNWNGTFSCLFEKKGKRECVANY